MATQRIDGTGTAPMTGRMLGDFMVHQQIGAGGFGAVYLAEQVSLGREAVIKIPLARADANSAFAAQFLREAQFASQLDHPYAAHIYAFGVEADGTLWTAMELVRGTPLNELLKSKGPLSIDKFVPLFDKLCEVVHTAHEQGIVHRDLKPANVMVIARAGRLLPKLLDLGIAKLTGADQLEGAASSSADASASAPATANTASDSAPSDATSATATTGQSSATTTGASGTHATRAGGDSQFVDVTQTVSAQATVGVGPTKMRILAGDLGTQGHKSETVGTPAYMAPEQWVPSIPTDARTDVYALGILAYEVLTGRLPFAGKNSMELARAHARQAPPPLGGDLPVALDAVIATALAKKKDQRFQTAVELAAAMRKATGFDQEPVKLPALDAQLRETLLATAPQPLAEAVSALDSVRNAHQGLSAVFQIMRVTTRLLGNLSLASWTHYGTLAERGHPEVARALGQLKRHGLDEMEWLDLAELIAAQFTDRRNSAPLPELIELFYPDTSRITSRTSDEPSEGSAVSRAMRAIVATKDHYENALAPDAATTKRLLEETMPQLQIALAGLAWLHDYLLVVPHGEAADRWMGTRRQPRAVVALAAGAETTSGEPLLVSQDGAPILRLAPFFQAAAPAPGQDTELFVLDGSGRSGARLVSMPTGFEKSDHALWGWLGTQVAIEALDSERKGNERAPYRGLAAFTADDADMFVGRERETEAVANRLRITAMLGIVGPSGAGKSSFIQAGVLPALGSHWKSVIVRPGGSPLLALRTMVRGLEGLEGTTDDALAGAGLGNVLRAWAAARKQSLMLYVDQFEELFTLCHDVAERKAYVDMLLNASLSPADPLRVVFTVRDDFLLRCQQLEALRDRLVSGLQLLATPTPDDLLRILIEPARRAGYEFDDPALPAEMVQAIADMPSALPLLSFTAAQLWELRDRQASKLARKAYESLGGVGGALAQHAERVLGGMSPEAQGLVRIVFRNLVTADGTRAILTRAEALEILGNHADAETTLEALIHARLLTASEGAGALDRIEVVHEALLSAWPRLINWRREDAEGARMRDQLRAAARQWAERNRDNGLLWRGDTLTEYRLWRARYPGGITALEEAFAGASIREALKSQRIRRIAASVLVTSLIITTIIFGRLRQEAIVSEAKAAQQLTESIVDQGRRSLLNNDPAGALMFFERAVARKSPDGALATMLARAAKPVMAELGTISGHDGGIHAMQLSPDRTRMLTSSEDGTLRISDVATTKLIAQLVVHEDKIHGFLYSAWLDDNRVASSGHDGVIRVWNAKSGALVDQIKQHDQRITNFIWHAPTHELVTSSLDRVLLGWNPKTRKTRIILDKRSETRGTFVINTNGDMVGIGFTQVPKGGKAWLMRPTGKISLIDGIDDAVSVFPSRDGNLAVISFMSNKPHVVVNTQNGKILHVLTGHDKPIRSVAINSDNTLVATGSEDQSVRVLELATGAVRVLRSHTAAISHLKFLAPQRLVSLSADGTAKLWDINLELLLLTLPHGGQLFLTDYNAGDSVLFTGSRTGTCKAWNISEATLAQSLGRGANNSAGYYEAPLLQGAADVFHIDDGGVTRWNLLSHEFRRLGTDSGATGQLGFVPRTNMLLHFDGGGLLQTLDPTSLAPLRTIAKDVIRMAVAPTGDAFAVVDTEGVLRWFDHFGTQVSTARTSGEVLKMVWSTNGRTLGVLSDGHVWVFDAHSRVLLAELSGEMDELWISPDGRQILTAELRDITVWDVAGRQLATLAHPAVIIVATFAPNGDQFYVGLGEGSVLVWDMATHTRKTTLPGDGVSVNAIVTSKNYVYTTTNRNEALIWDVAQLRLISRLLLTKDTLWSGPDTAEEHLLSIDRKGILTSQDIRSFPPAQINSAWLTSLIRDRIDPEVRRRAGFQ